LVVALFAITAAQLPDFYRRESDLRFEFVVPHTLDTDEPLPFRAIMCAASTDQHYIDVHFDGCRSTFESHLAKVSRECCAGSLSLAWHHRLVIPPYHTDT